jgi:TPR repeat protein
MEWLLKAAGQGYTDAQYNVGRLYSNGRGVTQDYPKAMDWYRKAADQGNVIALYNIGVLY